jgi:site-specific DNA-methyltransferase (adenine-specific)
MLYYFENSEKAKGGQLNLLHEQIFTTMLQHQFLPLASLERNEGQIEGLPTNPRQWTKAEISNLKKSIKETPELLEARGLIVYPFNNKYIILGGNMRYTALKELGVDQAPCVILPENLPLPKLKEIVIKDNGSFGEWDFDLLGNEWDDLPLTDWGVPAWGTEEKKEEPEAQEDDFDENEVEIPSRVCRGDIWQLGNHRLMCGDSTSAKDVAELMGGDKADMVFTDPPYNVAFNGRSGKFDVIENDNLPKEVFKSFIKKVCERIEELSPSQLYVWCNWKFYGLLQDIFDYNACIVWAKNNFGLGKGYRHQHEFCLFRGSVDEEIKNETDLWIVAKDAFYVHPTQKPIALAVRAMQNHKNCSNVVDLFGGSGSTLMAAEQLNRKAYLMELDPHYCDVIIARWETATNNQAVKIK